MAKQILRLNSNIHHKYVATFTKSRPMFVFSNSWYEILLAAFCKKIFHIPTGFWSKFNLQKHLILKSNSMK